MLPVAGTSRKRTFAASVSFGLPLLVYLGFASGYDYWLDSGEFVAVSTQLGIAHPPGHPLAAVLNGALAFLPLGSISLRVAWMCAVCAALSILGLFFAFERFLARIGVSNEAPRLLMALGASLWCAGSQAWLVQAVHPEVYALNAALLCWALERIFAFECAEGRDLRPLYQAVLLWALALANHHFLALLLMPAVFPIVWPLIKPQRARAMIGSMAALSLGLATYLYLPLRASTDPTINLGQPNTLSNFLWLVSARAFQHNTGSGVPQPLGERFLDVCVQLVNGLQWPTIVLGLLGIYALWRLPGRQRRYAYVWSMLLLTFAGARAWLGFVRSNPDALGYLMMAHVAVVAFALGFIAVLWRLAESRNIGALAQLGTALGSLLVLASLYHAWHTVSHASLRYAFNATDVFADPRRRDLPPKAVVLAFGPSTIFQYWSGAATEHLRPDIDVVAVPLLTYPHMIEQLTRKAPELNSMLLAYRRDHKFSSAELESLALDRPVFIEMDTRVIPDLSRTLAPWGMLYQVLPGGATRIDVRMGHRAQETLYDRIYHALGASQLSYLETSKQLLWLHYMDALYYASSGAIDASLMSVDRGLRLDPFAKELRALKRYLIHQPENRPVDIHPFLPS